MDIVTMLDELQKNALHDPEIRNRFLDNRQARMIFTNYLWQV